MTKEYCPLISGPCKKEECMWFYQLEDSPNLKGKCTISMLATELRNLNTYLKYKSINIAKP